MSSVVIDEYELPIPMPELERIAKHLRDIDVFCAGPTAGDIYNWRTCRRAHADGVTVTAILDRNVLKDVISLVSTAKRDFVGRIEDRARFGAAIMTYLLCSNILIDPALAAYEEPINAESELDVFRRADEGDAAMFAEVALGFTDRLNARCLPVLEQSRKPLPNWRDVPRKSEYRVAVLKVADLELRALNPYERISDFIQWTFDSYIFLPAAMNLAIQQFRQDRSKPVLRKITSTDRGRALRAVDNAVWDLTVAAQWAQRVTTQLEDKKFWVLCSRDRALKALAKTLHFSRDIGQTRESALREIFVSGWGASLGAELGTQTMRLMNDRTNPSRWSNQPNFAERIAQMTAEFEVRLRTWQPRT